MSLFLVLFAKSQYLPNIKDESCFSTVHLAFEAAFVHDA